MALKGSSRYELLGGSRGLAGRSLVKERTIKLLAAVILFLLVVFLLLHPIAGGDRHSRVYGVIVDAGSTGSRVHTFTFVERKKGDLELLSEDFFAVKPGLSGFRGNVEGARQSLRTLIGRAKKVVPVTRHETTPVFLRATAGLRMLGEKEAESVLNGVRYELRKSGFRFDSDDWASILKGSDEAIYSWITVNYLLDYGPEATIGILEMGGGSSQVAFVPKDLQKVAAQNCSFPQKEVDFKGSKLGLYTRSHLNYGIKKAKALVLQSFERSSKLIDNPCINKGALEVKVPFEEGKTLKMTGTGEYGKCRALVDEILGASVKSCNCDLCTYGGSAQPKPISSYVAFAFYVERTAMLGLESPLTVADIRTKGEEICAMTVAEVQRKYSDVVNGLPTDLCFDLSFITSNLELGHGLKEALGTKLMLMNKINGVELGWSLGAMFAEISKIRSGSQR